VGLSAPAWACCATSGAGASGSGEAFGSPLQSQTVSGQLLAAQLMTHQSSGVPVAMLIQLAESIATFSFTIESGCTGSVEHLHLSLGHDKGLARQFASHHSSFTW
jgi:hypothetical protein